VGEHVPVLRDLLEKMSCPFAAGERVGIKVHWGERGNRSFLSPAYVQEIVQWQLRRGAKPYIFDTTVLYSGGPANRRRIPQDGAG
jgi:uncharacterized protein